MFSHIMNFCCHVWSDAGLQTSLFLHFNEYKCYFVFPKLLQKPLNSYDHLLMNTKHNFVVCQFCRNNLFHFICATKVPENCSVVTNTWFKSNRHRKQETRICFLKFE